MDTTRAIAYCNGTRDIAGLPRGMRVLSLNNPGIGATPETPVEIGAWPGGTDPAPNAAYVHDAVPVGNRLYASSIVAGYQRIFDVTNPAVPLEIWSWSYPGAYTHNSWPDASGNWLYVTDEVNGEPLKIFDISTPTAPTWTNTLTANQQAIVHNAHVRGNELYLANYTEGLRVLDISDPSHPAEFGYADSYGGFSGGYGGVWGVCPYFPSGTVIASDMQTGLWVYRPVRNFGLVRVQVTNAAGGSPIGGIVVRVPTAADSAFTTADGIVERALDPGVHTIEIKAFGYETFTTTRTVTPGSNETISATLVARPLATISGVVKHAQTQAVLGDAEVDLSYTPLSVRTDGAGQYALSAVPADVYHVEVHRPGYIPIAFDRQIAAGPTSVQNFQLVQAPQWDALEFDTGWTVGASGDGVTTNGQGLWTRVTPLGTNNPQYAANASLKPATGGARARLASVVASAGASDEDLCGCAEPYACGMGKCGCNCMKAIGANTATGYVQPGSDRTPSPGSMCFVTGQGTNPNNLDEADVDLGRTTLTSPTLDATGLQIPAIGYWNWFYTQFSSPDDWLAVSISNDNGASWVPVDTTRGLHNEWRERTIRVADFVTPTNQVKVRFQAMDGGVNSIVEAAIDDLTLYDAATPIVGGPFGGPQTGLSMRGPWPNPGSGVMRLALSLPRAGTLDVDVLDVQGRIVRVLQRGPAESGLLSFAWDGIDTSGRQAPSGLYFVRAIAGGDQVQQRFVRVR
jgi:hypothetical protein